MKAAIVSIGSELLSGQILNRNAPWLSAKLFELGIDTVFQMTVDDQMDQIIECLRLARSKGALIFCTGGLGPTSDDLTREAVAQWLGKPLRYESSAWEHIEKIFSQFGTTPPESNKRQCYFPEESEILTNTAGTAHGFCFRSKEVEIFVLPGPPQEIEAIWRSHLREILSQNQTTEAKKLFHSWRTIGKGESHISEIVEGVCHHLLGQNLVEIAYRAHAPYIETKIRFLIKHEPLVKESLDELTKALNPWLYEKEEENWTKTLGEMLSKNLDSPIEIHDFWSSGQIQTALQPYLSRFSGPRAHSLRIYSTWAVELDQKDFFGNLVEKNRTDGVVSLALCQGQGMKDEKEYWMVALIKNGAIQGQSFPLPYQLRVPRERQELAVAYLAIRFWAQNLLKEEKK